MQRCKMLIIRIEAIIIIIIIIIINHRGELFTRETKTNEARDTKFIGKINNNEPQLAIVSVFAKLVGGEKKWRKRKKKVVRREAKSSSSSTWKSSNLCPLQIGETPLGILPFFSRSNWIFISVEWEAACKKCRMIPGVDWRGERNKT